METLEAIKLIREDSCPACGPQKLIGAERVSDVYNFTARLCVCCGRVFEVVYESDEPILSVQSVPPSITGDYPYRCAIDGLGHKWPVQYNNPNAEPLTELEKLQTDGKEITPADFECCSMWKELRNKEWLVWNPENSTWYFVLPDRDGMNNYPNHSPHSFYEISYCLSCGTPVP